MLKQWLNRRTSGKDKTDPYDLASVSLEPVSLDRRLDSVRFTVMDFETTGLNIRKDVPVAIGAIAVEHGYICLEQQFERIIYQPDTTANEATLAHGISPEQIESGESLAETLFEFYRYAANSVLIAFHAPFDKAILDRATKSLFGMTTNQQFVDAYDIAMALLPQHKALRGLDAWAEALNVNMDIERHHAAADAFVTAELMLILIYHAQKQGLSTLGQLLQKVEQAKRLNASHHGL